MKKIASIVLLLSLLFMVCGCESKKARTEREHKEKMVYEIYAMLHSVSDELEHIKKECNDTLKIADPEYTEETVSIVGLRCDELKYDVDKIIDKYALDIDY